LTELSLKHSTSDISLELNNMAESLGLLKPTCDLNTMMINRFVNFAKLQEKVSLVPHLTTVNLQECLDKAIRFISTLHNRVPSLILSVQHNFFVFDASWLFESLLTCLLNSVKSTTSSTETLITLRVREIIENEFPVLQFEIEDNGNGVSNDKKLGIFDFHVSSDQATDGTSMSLFILKSRMELMKGLCGIHDLHDGQRGVVISFQFPLILKTVDESNLVNKAFSVIESHQKLADRNESISIVASPAEKSIIELPLKTTIDTNTASEKLHVLIVDDSVPILRMISHNFIRAGHQVSQVSNGYEAVQFVENMNTQIDVILMDIQMPIMDGNEATRSIRQLPNPSSALIKIIGCSANSDNITIQQALQSGMNAFIPKPVHLKNFLETLQSIP
jgi:CheY-like chemotaxis protein